MVFFAALALAVTFILGAGCSSKAQEESKVSQQNAPGAKVNSQTSGANTNPQSSPDELVADLYKMHAKDQSPFFQAENRALVDKYFKKSLADLIWKDAVSSKGEVGALDSDPLYDAQDTEIKNFSVSKPRYENGQAVVTVSFENFGEKQEITYYLVSDKTNWKIADTKYKDGRTLSRMLKGQ